MSFAALAAAEFLIVLFCIAALALLDARARRHEAFAQAYQAGLAHALRDRPLPEHLHAYSLVADLLPHGWQAQAQERVEELEETIAFHAEAARRFAEMTKPGIPFLISPTVPPAPLHLKNSVNAGAPRMPEKRPLTSPAYERQDGEGDEAWLAFRTYRDKGPTRTLSAARDALGRPSGYDRMLEEWSSVWSWVRRIIEWERHLDNARRAAQEAEVVEMGKRQAAAAMKAQAGLLPFIDSLAERAALTAEELRQIPPALLGKLMKDLLNGFDRAAKLERLARGAPTENVQHTGAVVVDDLRSAYEERLRRRAGVETPHHEGRDAQGGDEPQPQVMAAGGEPDPALPI